ncbi:MAG: adenylyltransferase/cytidyltransferase family protein [Coriobacteriia bacterium]|nr:adenylyltransferase/cytidyltransferase family protein [Coriobacteriia bacterium]
MGAAPETTGATVSTGMVHGRFQLFHLEHLSYVLHALERCDQLVIGITNPDASQFVAAEESDHRHLREANPFSYNERQLMIRESLVDEGVDLSRIAFVPFHVLDPEQWPYYIPKPGTVTHFMRFFSEWEERKAAELRAHGYEVVQIDAGRSKSITATQVRALLAEDGDWRAFLPAGTVRVVERLGGLPRGQAAGCGTRS